MGAFTRRRSSHSAKSAITQMYNKENLPRLKKMDGLAPQVMKAFWAFDKAAVADGAIVQIRMAHPAIQNFHLNIQGTESRRAIPNRARAELAACAGPHDEGANAFRVEQTARLPGTQVLSSVAGSW